MSLFTILLDHPKGYFPGQNVTGRVIFNPKKEIDANFLKIRIRGGAHTKWEERISNKVHEYKSDLSYASEEKVAWFPKNGISSFGPGEQSFPFSFLLPTDCPPSFEGKYGHISYSICVEMGRSACKSNKTERKVFRVFPNFEPDNTKLTKLAEKDIGTIFKKGMVKMTVSIPKRTIVPGEVLPITLEIENASKRSATCIRAELHQRSDFYCQNTPITHYSNHHQIESKRLAENRKDINIESQTQGLEKLEIKIPYVLPPTVKCPIIENRYYLSVELVTATSLNNTLYCEFDIIMVPKRNRVEGNASISDPSAPTAIHRAESLPPPYSSSTRTAPSAPPTYKESTTKPSNIEFC